MPALSSEARAIALLALAAFVSASAFRICDPMLPQLAAEFGASTGQAARAVTAFAVAYGVLQMFFGPVGDRYGKYRVVSVATFACALGSAGAFAAETLDALVLCRALSGAAGAGIVPLSMAWIGDTVPYERRQATLARFLTGTILGMAAGQLAGGLFMAVLVSLTLCLNVQRIVDLISAVTPLLLALVIVLVIYALFRSDTDIETLNALAAQQQDRAAPNWFLGGVLYASFNIAVGFPLLAVLSGGSTNLRNTTRGGVLGGLGLGVLILLLNVGLFATLDQIEGAEMATVLLAKSLNPWLGWLMMVSLCCMIYSTAVGMFFAFSARFADPETPKFRLISVVSSFVGLGLSFVGFTTLVGTVYPLLGYLGLALIVGVIVYWWRHRHA